MKANRCHHAAAGLTRGPRPRLARLARRGPGALAGAGVLLAPAIAAAQAKAGWGNVGQQEEKGFSWTDPLWPDFWMAWTPATLAVFVGIFSAIALIAFLEIFWLRDGLERRGILGLTTTLGDRLFITLLGSAYIFLAWLGFVGQPIWIPLFIAVGWGIFVFWRV